MWRVLFPVAIALSGALGQARLTPEARQEILDYKLTMQRANQLIAALPEMSKFVLSLSPEARAKAAKATPAERLANTANNPTSAAMMIAEGIQAPDIFASPANVAFVKVNLAELEPRWAAANGLSRPAK